MYKEYLYERNLFPIRIADYIDTFSNRYLLYSPLAHNILIADPQAIEQLAAEFVHNGKFSDPDLQRKLIDEQINPVPNYVTSPYDVFALTILPNNICNFSCSYCYASKGHGHDEISEDALRNVLDFFISPSRIKRHDLYISFGGGGEPLLSWQKMRYAIEYSSKRAEKYGFNIHFSFASNGSVIDNEIIKAIHHYNIKTNISFDIIEKIQNTQRKNYDVVCKTLDRMLDENIIPTINSVITPLNVELQMDMVEQLHSRFPKIRRLSFDYVVDANLYRNPESLRIFYDRYIENFFLAQETGKRYGITVSSIKYHNLEQIKMRACAGGFDLSAQGKISMCFFVSSPKEPLFNDFVYGEIKSNGILQFDENKFKTLVEASENRRKSCQHCFIRWHCGGGCLYQIKTYKTEMLDVMCEFQKKFSLIALLNNALGHNVLEGNL